MRAGAPAASRTSGFTLVEMLVGLALLALIMTFLSPLLFEARRAMRVIERPSPQAPISAAQAYLRSGITQAFPAVPGISGDQSRLGIYGTTRVLNYATTYATQGAYQGLYVVTVQLVANSSGSFDLVADEEMYRPTTGLPARAPVRRLTLVENVASVNFAYYATPVGEDAPWRAEWPRSRTLPELVEIDVTFPERDERTWPAQRIRPAAAAASRVLCPPRIACD